MLRVSFLWGAESNRVFSGGLLAWEPEEEHSQAFRLPGPKANCSWALVGAVWFSTQLSSHES